ncbi:OmpA family protein [Hyalangium rubrum]|uniref:OmpA family protein n=1 Tax=Hyalangium rubrum TaxID=3103134 RepID=A0ABU5HB82_9BACT|nr:OmpA family protein [Hyalangium sp. s54d21]MDY7230052.1 OmpA family protein [Hyalangium sp. s54d21]
MEHAPSAAKRRRRAWLPWALLAGTGVVVVGGGWMTSRSISALTARNAQLEQEAIESEARVAELQVLRSSMERRLRLLEQQQTGVTTQRDGEARKARETEAQMLRREAARQSLVTKLKDELAVGDAWLDTVPPESLRLELSERLLFEPGQSALTPRGVEVLTRVGNVLAGVDGHAVAIVSHTDELPPAATAGPAGTSWELSTARATTVVRSLLEGPTRMAPERLSATGQASFRPVVPSDSPQNRLRNRRLELTLSPMPLPPAALVAATPPAPPPAPAKAEARGQAGKKTARR